MFLVLASEALSASCFTVQLFLSNSCYATEFRFGSRKTAWTDDPETFWKYDQGRHVTSLITFLYLSAFLLCFISGFTSTELSSLSTSNMMSPTRVLFNYFPVICIWKHCRFFPLYYSACDLFSCYPAGSCFFIDEDLLKWESFLQLNTLSLRNHSHFTCKGCVLKPIQAIQSNCCFLFCEVFFSQVVYVVSGRALRSQKVIHKYWAYRSLVPQLKGKWKESKPTAPPEARCHHRHLPQGTGTHDGFALSRKGGPSCGKSRHTWGDALTTTKGRAQF